MKGFFCLFLTSEILCHVLIIWICTKTKRNKKKSKKNVKMPLNHKEHFFTGSSHFFDRRVHTTSPSQTGIQFNLIISIWSVCVYARVRVCVCLLACVWIWCWSPVSVCDYTLMGVHECLNVSDGSCVCARVRACRPSRVDTHTCTLSFVGNCLSPVLNERIFYKSLPGYFLFLLWNIKPQIIWIVCIFIFWKTWSIEILYINIYI